MPPITHFEDGRKKKALLVAVRYDELHKQHPDESPSYKLPGTHLDPPALASLLVEHYGYSKKDIVILMDDGKHDFPTRENIIREMYRLVADARAGDHFVFHFSGHGSQIKNMDGTEEDGYDEVIWPMDIECDPKSLEDQKNYIIDDDLKKILVDSLPPDARLACLLDCCHSGTGLDLPYNHSDDSLDEQWSPQQVKAPVNVLHGFEGPGVVEQANRKGTPKRAMSLDTVTALSRSSTITLEKIEPSLLRSSTMAVEDPVPKNTRGISRSMKMPYSTRGVIISLDSDGQSVIEDEELSIDNRTLSENGSGHLAYVTSWSACLDDQLGLDTGTGGILTCAFHDVLQTNKNRTNREMLANLSKALFDQGLMAKQYFKDNNFEKLPQPKPCLGSLRPLEDILDETFTF